MRPASPADALREVFAGEVLLGRSTISPAAWLTATRHRRRRSRGALRRGSDHDPAKALLLDGLPERKAVSSPSLDSRVDRHAELDRALSIASRDGIVTAVLRVSSASKLSSARMAKQVSRAAYPSDLLVASCATDPAARAHRGECSLREACSSADGRAGACSILANRTARFCGPRPAARRLHSSRAIVATSPELTSATATFQSPEIKLLTWPAGPSCRSGRGDSA